MVSDGNTKQTRREILFSISRSLRVFPVRFLFRTGSGNKEEQEQGSEITDECKCGPVFGLISGFGSPAGKEKESEEKDEENIFYGTGRKNS